MLSSDFLTEFKRARGALRFLRDVKGERPCLLMRTGEMQLPKAVRFKQTAEIS